MRRIVFLLPLLIMQSTFAQSPRPIDVKHYSFHISLSDRTDSVQGTTNITFQSLKDIETITLDLSNEKQGKGMTIYSILDRDFPLPFVHKNDSVVIQISPVAKPGQDRMITIKYAGIPGNGLVISKNKLGQRTFFADHWPDRAHHWLPCNDHPGDKASVEFIVTAPDHYQVVSNGIQIEETNLSDNTKLTHWKETQPLPMKIAVIGVARFAVHHAGDVNGIPVQSWVYPEMKQWGFQDYAIATDILKWFIDYVGPYPYKKLANVQSKTIFGGMENASAIFYHEGSVDGKKSEEALIAHEIAHQWFGNMATEKDFSHLWLSEGFATYLTDVYLESKYGRDSARRKLQGERRTVINFAKRNTKPVVDPKTPYMQLLNANSYQKGAWFLHMLRNKIGDSAFHRTIRAYYARFAGKNANTDDFRRVAEENSRQRLEPFFRQWLYTAGHPVLKITWEHKSSDKVLLLHSKQEQEAAFEFPLEIDIITTKGKIRKSILIDPKTISTTIKNIDGDVKEVILDPDTNLLFEGSIQRR